MLSRTAKSTGISMSRMAAMAGAGVAARMHGTLSVELPTHWPGEADRGDHGRSYFTLAKLTALEPHTYVKDLKKIVDDEMRVLVGVHLQPGSIHALLPRDVVVASLGQFQRNRSYMFGVVDDVGVIRWLDAEWRWLTENGALAAEAERLLAWGALLGPLSW